MSIDFCGYSRRACAVCLSVWLSIHQTVFVYIRYDILYTYHIHMYANKLNTKMPSEERPIEIYTHTIVI